MPTFLTQAPALTNWWRTSVSVKVVGKLLLNQKPHKTTGPDEIQSFIIKSAAYVLAPLLTKVYQFSLGTGNVPQVSRDALVVPIFKKGELHKPVNYIPDFLTSTACKILEHIITGVNVVQLRISQDGGRCFWQVLLLYRRFFNTQYSLVFRVISNVLLNFKLKWYRFSHSLVALKWRNRQERKTRR